MIKLFKAGYNNKAGASMETTAVAGVARRVTAPSMPVITEEDRRRVEARLAKDYSMSLVEASEVFQATMDFLTMAARFPGNHFVPSAEVDKGWHTFLLYTRAYRAFSRSLGREFIDHEPSDGAREVKRGGLRRTVAFMREHGIAFNERLWPVKDLGGDCEADPCNCTGEEFQG